MTKQKFLRKIFKWIIIYCKNVARDNAPYFPVPGPDHLQLNLTPKCKMLNVFWTQIASKRRIKQFDFFSWLSNVKNLVLSNGSEYLRNVIQWH